MKNQIHNTSFTFSNKESLISYLIVLSPIMVAQTHASPMTATSRCSGPIRIFLMSNRLKKYLNSEKSSAKKTKSMWLSALVIQIIGL